MPTYSVTVKSGSSQNKITDLGDHQLVIWTHARAHDGEANAAIIKQLSAHFKVSKSQVKILRGHTSKHKLIDIFA